MSITIVKYSCDNDFKLLIIRCISTFIIDNIIRFRGVRIATFLELEILEICVPVDLLCIGIRCIYIDD
jgi:hypothetical protein